MVLISPLDGLSAWHPHPEAQLTPPRHPRPDSNPTCLLSSGSVWSYTSRQRASSRGLLSSQAHYCCFAAPLSCTLHTKLIDFHVNIISICKKKSLLSMEEGGAGESTLSSMQQLTQESGVMGLLCNFFGILPKYKDNSPNKSIVGHNNRYSQIMFAIFTQNSTRKAWERSEASF